MSNQITLWGVFVAGMVSFLSPCILPLMPVYLGHLTGLGFDESEPANAVKNLAKVLYHSIAFLVGLTMVNILLGLTATALGRFLVIHGALFRQISGTILVVFGLYHSGLLKWGLIRSEKRFNVKSGAPGFLRSIVLGIVFGFGWTPCISYILGAVLVLAAGTTTLWVGVGYLLLYSLGFGVLFLISAVFMNQILSIMMKSPKHFDWLKKATGVVISILGVLIFTGWINRLLAWITF